MAPSPLSGGTLSDIPLLVINRIVALVASTLASPPEPSEKKERAKKEFVTLLKLCSALPEWAGAVRDLGLVANVKANQKDVHDGQCVSCTLADGSTRAKVPLPLVRSILVGNAVPSGLDMTEMEPLCAVKVDGVDMCDVDFLPPVKHLEIQQCRGVKDKLSDWLGACTARSPCGTGGVGLSRVCARNRTERVASTGGLPHSA
jgi:hypothetical protein